MSYFLGITDLISFDLVHVDSLRKFVCLTEGYYRYFVLTRNIGDH